MKEKLRFLAVVLAFFVVACVDGARDNEIVLGGGIGGTGITTWEGGIGGTGVVGTITGFGSIIINGLHVNYDQKHSVDSALGAMTPERFAVGQVVAAQTTYAGGRLVAVRLVHHLALAGPVQAIDPVTRKIRVLGEAVHVMPGAVIGAGRVEDLRVGQSVMVSGLRGADGVFASRIDPSPQEMGAVVSGTVSAKAGGTVVVDGRLHVQVSLAAAAQVAVGDFVSFGDVRNAPNGQLQVLNIAGH